MTLIQHVWKHNHEWTGFSWERLNHSMAAAVQLAMHAGLKFNKQDFVTIQETMRVRYWCGADLGERWYAFAIAMNHPTAIAAYETWRCRKPFLIVPTAGDKTKLRLHVGAEFDWHTKLKTRVRGVKVTSFTDDQTAVIACTYKTEPDYPRCAECGEVNWRKVKYSRSKIDRRFRITHADIAAYHAAIRERRAEANA